MDITKEEVLPKSKSKKKKKQIKQEPEEENIDLVLNPIALKKKKKKEKNKETNLHVLSNERGTINFDNDKINSSETENKNLIANMNSDINGDKSFKKKRKKQKYSEIEDVLVLNNSNSSTLESSVNKKSKKKKRPDNEDSPNAEQQPVQIQTVEAIQENADESNLVKKKKKKKQKLEQNLILEPVNSKQKKRKNKSHEVHEQINDLEEISAHEPAKKKRKSSKTESELVAKTNKNIKQEPPENNIEFDENFDDINGNLVIKPKKRKNKSHEVHEEINTDEPVKKKKKSSITESNLVVKKKKKKNKEPEAEESRENNIELNDLTITNREKSKNKIHKEKNNFQDIINTKEPIKETSLITESDSVVKKKKKKKIKQEPEADESHANNIELNNPSEITNRKKSKNNIHEEHEQITDYQDNNTKEPIEETASIPESGSTVKKKKKKKQKSVDSQENNTEEPVDKSWFIEGTSVPESPLPPPNNEQRNETNLGSKPKSKKIKKERNVDHLIAQIKEEPIEVKSDHSSVRSDSIESLRIDSPLDRKFESDSSDDTLTLEEVAFTNIRLKILEQKRKLKNKHHEAVDKTRGIDVILPKPVAPLHKIEDKVSGYPKREQTLQMEAICPNMKKGAYTRDEDSTIKENFKEFCKMHDLRHDPVPFLNWRSCLMKIMKKEDRIRFVQFLGYGLSTRPLYSIYNRFKTLFDEHHKKLGRFTKEEDETIMEYLSKTASSKPFADLAKILRRQPLAIERRAIKIKAGNSLRFIITRKSATELVTRILEVTKYTNHEDLRDRTITTEEWKKIGTYFEPIAVNKIRNAWLNVVYPKLFIEKSTFTPTIKKKVIELLVECEAKDWKDVNWDKIGKEIDGLNGQLVYKLFKRLVITYVPKNLQKDLKKILEYLVQEENNLILRKFKFEKLYLVDLDQQQQDKNL